MSLFHRASPLALIALGLAGCGQACDTAFLDAQTSPDGAYEVRAWQRTCDGNGPADLQFELVEADAETRALARREQVFLVARGEREDISLTWPQPGMLSVTLNIPADQVLGQKPDQAVGEDRVAVRYTAQTPR